MNYGYDRLSQQDSMYMMFETPAVHMHVGGTSIFEAGPLTRPDGGLEIDRIRAHINSRLHLAPRYRQKLAYTPIQKSLIWVDDDTFDITYHVRHASLPRPGTLRQLKDLSGRIMSQQLRRDKPLWEIWVVEGLEGDRFATISKTHHSVMDGTTGVSLAAALMSTSPDDTEVEAGPIFIPRRPPNWFEIVWDEAGRRAMMPLNIAESVREAVSEPKRTLGHFMDNLSAIKRTVSSGIAGAAQTPFNQKVGPQRRIDWSGFDLEQVKEVRNRLGGTVNDVMLSVVAGGMRTFLKRRRVKLKDLSFKVVIPVDVRKEGEGNKSANCVSMWIMDLPVDEADPHERLSMLHETSKDLKEVQLEKGMELLNQANEWLGVKAFTLAGVELANWAQPYNLLVTNVPGPSFPLYQLGAKLLETYPHAPLFDNQGFAIALFSYLDRVNFGVIADWDLTPDLATFIEDVEAAFEEMLEVAGIKKKPRKVAKKPRKAAAKKAKAKKAKTKKAALKHEPEPERAEAEQAAPKQAEAEQAAPKQAEAEKESSEEPAVATDDESTSQVAG